MTCQYLKIQLFDGAVVVGVNADVAGDAKALLHNSASVELSIIHQCPGRCLGEGATRPYGNQINFRFNNVAVAGNDEGGVFVRDRQ